MKYKCGCCGCVFDEEDAIRRTETEEFWGMTVPIYYMVCPECREDISEEDEYEEEDEEEEFTLTDEQITEMWESGYIKEKTQDE